MNQRGQRASGPAWLPQTHPFFLEQAWGLCSEAQGSHKGVTAFDPDNIFVFSMLIPARQVAHHTRTQGSSCDGPWVGVGGCSSYWIAAQMNENPLVILPFGILCSFLSTAPLLWPLPSPKSAEQDAAVIHMVNISFG